MKRYLIFLSIMLLLSLIPNKVLAANLCENKVLSDYRSLASNINITYTYKVENGKPLFDVIISNIYDDIYIVDTIKNKTYTYKNFTSETEIVLKGYSDGQTIKYQIYTSATGCYGQLLATRYVTFPKYNEYSTDAVCKGAEEYSLCQRWGTISGTYEDFVSNVNKYKESKNKVKYEEPKPVKAKTLMELIFSFVGKYYVFLVAGVIIIILIVAAIRNVSLRKNQFDFKV